MNAYVTVILLVQQMLSCFDRNGCDGGSPEEACYWMEENSIELTTERTMPYRQTSGGYVDTLCSSPSSSYTVSVRRGSIHSIVTYIEEFNYDESILKRNIQNMKNVLITSGPFYCAMSVYDDFFSYSGTKPYEPQKGATLIGGHAIEVIGYCELGQDTRKGFSDTAYWICKNSWGEHWPTQASMSGYFTIPTGKNICGIESRCGYAIPQVKTLKRQNLKPLQLTDLRYENFQQYSQSSQS
jgi:cathepsin O